jgi:hypothetical protein
MIGRGVVPGGACFVHFEFFFEIFFVVTRKRLLLSAFKESEGNDPVIG